MTKKNNLPNVWNKAGYSESNGTIRWNSSNEKMYVLKARKGCLPVWEEIDPFEDLEERKVKK
mgnify:CR=1 FL=1|tara:strand:- start:1504 stop:1689 length:186 start_codon:yes stop_codon:yes gene_type:complete